MLIGSVRETEWGEGGGKFLGLKGWLCPLGFCVSNVHAKFFAQGTRARAKAARGAGPCETLAFCALNANAKIWANESIVGRRAVCKERERARTSECEVRAQSRDSLRGSNVC